MSDEACTGGQGLSLSGACPHPKATYVGHIPDLMTWDDYEVSHERKLVRFRLTVTDQGLEIIGDSPYPHLLEELLAKLDPAVLEMMLCG